jgi:hypothetical protein
MEVNALGATEATQSSILDGVNAIILLRRIVRLMESQAAVDATNRQRVTIDAITNALTLSTVTTVGTVSSVTDQSALAGMGREMYINQARVAYNTGIRAKITP